MSALVKNLDLVPDERTNLVDMQQTIAAMLRVGIHPAIAQETAEANFQSSLCPTCPTHINLFEMNTIDVRAGEGTVSAARKAELEAMSPSAGFTAGQSPPNQPHEHFRSTVCAGIPSSRPHAAP